MKVTTKSLGLIMVLIFIIGISSTIAAGTWSTENVRTPQKYTEEALSEQYNPDEIKGSYTFAEISTYFEIEESVLREAFRLEESINLSNFATKDLELLYGENETELGNGSVKMFVALYLNLPFELGDDYLLEEAVSVILSNNNNLTESQIDYLNSHTLYYEDLVVSDTVSETSSQLLEGDAFEITASTTFQQILDAGVTKAQIEEIIGGELPSLNTSIRDYCLEHDLEYSLVKESLLEFVLL
jgi:hypothetical protein